MSEIEPVCTGEPLVRERFPAEPRALREIRARVLEAARAAGCSDPDAQDLVIAVDEACQNIIRHGYRGESDREILIEVEHDGAMVVVYLVDAAPTVDPTKIQPRRLDDVRPGGLGTHFIRELTDDWQFLPTPSGRGNALKLCKKIDRGE